ncbi:MAG: hypothetical protein FD161_3721 [Limisphaerales bacterium]|nr:MAG: hypothetical protein FD161_3721 [Limisphaerales bacterium]KAG0507527.1 MAG: hypothetical protein E1N63_3318 [Limisphaerales bacterium]TXT48973.1 MAG: hypothetical protein FD140_3355 [Limisphaerales bacterium]
MAKQDYLPDQDPQLLLWHDNFKNQTAALKTTFGLTDPEVAAVATDNGTAHTKVDAKVAARNAAKTATEACATSLRTIKTAARALARRLKEHPAYTAALGQQLGIIGPEDTTDLSTSKPTLTVDDTQNGQVTIGFNKSISDGVNIYTKRGSETVFTFLARDTFSPYVDNRPNLNGAATERREYQAVYVSDDAEIGLRSDTAAGVLKA